MRIVVTGALGYVGSRLTRELGDALPGSDFVMLDNRVSERPASLLAMPTGARYRVVDADILTASLPAVIDGADAVIHLAAITNGTGAEPRTRMHAVNLTGTERLARACAAARVPVLFPSTTSVYGTSGTVTEDGPPSALRPQTPYAEWKLQSERLLHDLGASAGLRFAIFRMGTVFGPAPGIQYHTAVNRFCAQAVARQPLEIWRTAIDQYRPYLDVGDAARAIRLVVTNGHFDGRVYNVATINATVRHVVETLSRYVPGVGMACVDSPHMNGHSYSADTSRIRQLGFAGTGSLAQGIRETLAQLAAGDAPTVSEGGGRR